MPFKLGLFRRGRRQGRPHPSARETARRRSLHFRHSGLEQLEQRTLLSVGLQFDHVVASSGVGNNVPFVRLPAGSSTPPDNAFNPTQIKQAYGIDQVKDKGITQDGTGETIAIIDAFDDPKFVSRNNSADVSQDPNFLASDLHQFDLQYNLPEPAGFFTKVDQTGGTNYPIGDTGWGTEIALDVEWVHALAPGAKIILVEANSNYDSDLLNGAAVWARDHSGAQVVTMSFGGDESGGDPTTNSIFQSPADHGITWLASTGDSGVPGGYPSFSPNVVAVGGTTLTAPGGVYGSESGWSGSGGGISADESQPSYQQGLLIHSGNTVINQNGKRATPDVAFDADLNSGVAVCDSYSQGTDYPWIRVGGTSFSSPAWAAMMGITDEIRANHGLPSLDGPSGTLPTLYQIYNTPSRYAYDFHDVTAGSNGYSAATGYDLVTGMGSPKANTLLLDLAGVAVLDTPPTVTGTTPSLAGGTLASGRTTLAISFSEAVVGGDTASNFALQSVGSDGLLGTADDTFVPLSASYSNGTATLTFPALAENVYRLTVRDTITDVTGNQLDGNGDGLPGGNWTTDFVVIAPNTTGFAPVSTFGSGVTPPIRVAVGDFNGDGKLDLAVANYASTPSVGILLGNGNGTFAAASTVSPGSYGYCGDILANDFNGDGKLDLAVVDGGEVGILLGDGAGGFSPVTTFNSHGGNSLVAADFNGDGKLDLACASDMSNTQINVLFNNGNGGFGAPTAFNSGGIQPQGLAVGDFDGDGNPDLAVANYQSNTIGILLGDGHGGFTAPTAFDCGGNSPLDVAVGDFNGDGKADIVVTNSWSGTVGVLLGNGSGSFGAATTFSFGVASPDGIAAGDLNGDGKADVAIPDFSHGAVGVLFGNGHGGFAAPVTFGSGGTSCTSAVFGDFNGDGRPDIVVTNYGGNTIGVLTNTSDVFSVTDTSPHGLPFDIAVGSFGAGELIQGYNNAFDGDGRLIVGGTAYQPSSLTHGVANNGQTVTTAAGTLAGLTVSRQITVPNSGGEDFARTIDTFANSGTTPITTTVQIACNLGSDLATTVFATSSGDMAVSPSDQWIGTDDASDGSGTPAVIHYIHGPAGLQPSSVGWVSDNLTWTYSITVPAGQTVQLAYFTIVGTTESSAIAAATALVTPSWFGDKADAFLTASQSAALANFGFPPPTIVSTSPTLSGGSLAAGSTSLAINFSRPVVGANLAANYKLQSSGADGLLGTADDVVLPLSATYSGTTATLTFAALPEQVYRLTVRATITDPSGNPLGGTAGDWHGDFVAVPTGNLAPVTLTSSQGLPFDVAVGAFGEGELIQGSNNAFDGDGRLFVNGTAFQPTTASYTLGDSGHTALLAGGITAGLTVQRQVTVPTSGGYDLARTIDTFTNPSGSAVTVSVQIVGNLGSDANTTIFGTSSGDTFFTPADQWVGTDDNVDGHGTPAIIHYVHSSYGAQPSAVSVSGDNISWTYTLTVPAAGTVRLAYFTIVATTRSQATAAANALVTTAGFSDQAGTYLTPSQIGSLANFVFPGTTPPAILGTSPALSGGTLAAGTTSLGITFSKPVVGAATAANYQLQSAGPDGLLGTADDVILPLTASYHGAKASLVFPPLMENVYRLTVHDTITDLAGNVLQGSGSGGAGDWTSDFVVTPGSASVYAPSPYSTGTYNPQGVVVADFNRDGIPDVAVANTSGSVTILLGDGSGRFSVAGTYNSGGSYSYAIATGDFNGDGNLDLAVANFNSGTVGVLLGDGSGGFSTATTYSSGGSYPECIVAADLNGDGIVDLATANESSGTIGFLRGNGNGTFRSVVTTSWSGSAPNALAVADFNGDNRMDLAVTNATNNTVGIFLGSGNGSFGLAGSYASGGNVPCGLATGDFNGDGKPDLVVVNNSTTSWNELGVVELLLNNGSGTFTPGTPVSLADDLAQKVTVGDFNGDGKLDVAASYALNSVAILWGNGAGGLSTPSAFFTPVKDPYFMAAADLNGDGRLDLTIGSSYGAAVGILLNDGKGGFAPPDSSDFASGGSTARGVLTADFNRDGKPDLAVVNEDNNTVGILLGNGDGTFAAVSTYGTGSTVSSWNQFLAAGDFNGDGNPDLVVTNSSQGTVAVLLGDGQGHFSAPVLYNTGLNGPSRIRAADFNGDGKLDLVVLDSTYNSTLGAVLLGTGTGGFLAPKTFNTGGTNPWGLAIGDLNGDGKLDLVVANCGNSGSVNSTLGIDLGDGAGGFSLSTTKSSGSPGLYGITEGDFNKDGAVDVAVANSGNSTVSIFFGNGHGGFSNSSPVSYDSVVNIESIVAADLNGDGYPDIAVPSLNNSVGILLSNGTGGFLPMVTYLVNGQQPAGIVAGDFNGDGKLDLAESNETSNSVGILLNVSGPAPVTLNSPHSVPFNIAVGNFGTGELVQGLNNAFDGDGRLMVGGTLFRPTTSTYTTADSGQSVVTAAGTAAGLTVSRKITVPNTGNDDFARTVDTFTNSTGSAISTTVTIVGNLGSEANTTVFATSDGDTTVETSDQWIGTDDASDGSGTPAVIHYIHGPMGLRPVSVSVTGDNITWTYNLTVPAAQTVRLESYTIVATTRAAAVASAKALVTSSGFGGQAAAFLSPSDLTSLANFAFNTAPEVVNVSVSGSTWTSSSLAGGYSIPVGCGAQLLVLPAANIDQIKVTFSENVIVDPSDLLLTGVNTPSYNVSGGTFSYDSTTFTATWTLPQPIGPDKLMLTLNADGSDPIRDLAGHCLDGEWTNPASTTDTGGSAYPSGSGMAGGDFHFRLNVLPGDAGQDGVVGLADLNNLLTNYGKSGMTLAQGDFTGDGAVGLADLNSLLTNYGLSLPSAEPTAGSFPAVVSRASAISLVPVMRVDVPAASPAAPPSTPLTLPDLQPAVSEATAGWAGVGLFAATAQKLARVQFDVSDLPGPFPREAAENPVDLATDKEASTPSPNKQPLPAIDPRVVDRMDLGTVAAHQWGPVAGSNDLDALTDDVMSGVLGRGVLRNVSHLDAVLASF